jgi:hypothetical protein
MQRAWRETFGLLLSAFALFAIECQTLTGAHERSLMPENGTDSGSPTGGGAGTASGAGATGGDGGSGGAGGAGGSIAGSQNGGTGSSEDAGDSGEPAGPPDVVVSSCPRSYVDWFQSSFAAIDRDMVGSADFTPKPWNTSGDLKIVDGRLSGTGAATASQGRAFPYEGLRLRYKGRFTDSSQRVVVALNAQSDGSEGVRVEVMASGKVALIENGVQRGITTLPPLAINRDWYLEMELGASRATVRLSDVNYPGETGTIALAMIENAPLDNTALGKFLSIALTGAAELPSSVDELFVARCGLTPPAHELLLKDAFDRQDSSALGNAEVPPTSTWFSHSTDISIARSTLYFFEPGGSATVPIEPYSMDDGIRLRFRFHTDFDAAPFFLSVVYNHSLTQLSPTFTISSINGTSTEVVVGVESHSRNVAIARTLSYSVQVDVQGDIGVLTLRTRDYTGPIVAIVSGRGLAQIPNIVRDVTVIANRDMAIEEIELARYVP